MAPKNSDDAIVEAGSKGDANGPADANTPAALSILRWETEGGAVPHAGGAHVGDARAHKENGLDSLDFTDRGADDKGRVIKGEWLKRKLGVRDGEVSGPVVIRHAIIEIGAGETLDLSQLTFKRGLSITESVFKGDVEFSFCVFERGVDLTGSVFEGEADFRAARVEGDFRIPLASFREPARFDDMCVGQILSAEGADFAEASFDRIEARKGALFCCALLDGGRAVRTQFREVTFNDAHFLGPTYFNGAHFHGKAYFDRVSIDSSAFFNCDLLSREADSSQPRHKVHRLSKREVGGEKREYVPTEFEDAASFIGAKIQSSVSFSGARFGRANPPGTGGASQPAPKADFRRVQIEGTALFDPFQYKERGIFERVRFFYDANFWNASIKGAAKFEAVYFGGEANFEHLQVGRRAYFCAAGHDASPISPEFRGDVTFLDADVKGTISFEGAQFGGHATFERLTTGGSLHFRVYEPNPPAFGLDSQRVCIPVRFARSVRFLTCRTRSNLQFDGAQFPADETPKDAEGAFVKDEANFSRMVVGGNLYLRPWRAASEVVHFGKEAVFAGVEVKGRAEFSGTRFGAATDFTGMQVTGNAYFDCKLYRDEDDEPQDEGNGGASGGTTREPKKITPVKFAGPAEFNGATFHNQVSFEGAEFGGEADFTGVTSVGAVSFKETKFNFDVVFRETRFSSLWFDRKGPHRKGLIISAPTRLWALRSKESNDKYKRERDEAREQTRQFRGTVDLRGCVYDRIEVKLRSLLEQLKGSAADDPQRYDRQPYTQMSKTLRAVGDDRRAEFVYVKQRIRELVVTWNRLLRDLRNLLLWRAFRDLANLLLDLFLWAVAQFGVQPERLLVISFAVIAVGARVFSFNGAVQHREPNPDAPPTTATIRVTRDDAPWTLTVDKPDGKPVNLPWSDSLRFSVSQFLPIVDIPSGSRWKPSQNNKYWFWFVSRDVHIPYDVYGSAHRLLGAVLVPLLLAAVAASLYRRFKTEM